jgi:hypothetical protein
MFKHTTEWCKPPRPEGKGTGDAQIDAWRQACWSNADAAVAYEKWLFFETSKAEPDGAPFAFAWRRSETSAELIWAVSLEFEQINALWLRACRVLEAARTEAEKGDAYLLMHTCFRKAADVAASWEGGFEVQRLWPEVSQEQLEKCAQISLGFAHACAISSALAEERRAGAWRALRGLLLKKPELHDADEPATLQQCGESAKDDQLRIMQVGASVFSLRANAKLHFDAGRVEHACACAKQAQTMARLEIGEDGACYFDCDLCDLLAKEYDMYDYVKSKVNACDIDFHMNLCAEQATLPLLFAPLTEVYVYLNAVK